MRILFAGSPSIAVPSLETLSTMEGTQLAGVLTNPDSPRGRGGKALPTEVGEAANIISRRFAEQGKALFPVLRPLKLDASAREQVAALKPCLLVSFAYGRIFGPKFLALFPLGGINVHPSLLPQYRGPSPIQAAILNRDEATGLTVQTLANEMDSGDILAQEQVQLTGRETSGTLSEIMAQKACTLLPQVLAQIASGANSPRPQDHGKASYCSLVSREEALIDWRRSAVEIDAAVRAYNPWPLARTVHKGKDLFIINASVYSYGKQDAKIERGETPGVVLGIDKQAGILVQTGEGVLAVTELQYQAKKALEWKAFMNGARDFAGSKLG
jgi:methionyl-tRNA formyltransferase